VHSSKEHSVNVYHNSDRCRAVQSIAMHNRIVGTGGSSLCRICKRLNEEAKFASADFGKRMTTQT